MKELYSLDTHKWSLASSLLFASGLVLIGLCAYIIFGSHTLHARENVGSGQVIQKNMLNHDMSVEYPILRLNKVDASFRAYAEQVVDAYLAKTKTAKNDPHSSLKLTYDIIHYGLRMITVKFYQEEKIASQASQMSRKLVTFDLERQKLLGVEDVFKPETDTSGVLSGLLYDYFKQNNAASPELIKLLNLKLSDIQDIALGDETITLFLNPHDLSSRKNIQAITIKKSLLAPVLNAPYSLADTEHRSDIRLLSDFSIQVQPPRANRIDPNGKLLALTFDDGPDGQTLRVLDALRTYRSRATFFVLGSLVAPHADIVNRTISEGSEIGNHSWNHPFLTSLSQDQLIHQIDDTQNTIKQVTSGYTPTQMRPPYGVVNGGVAAFLAQRGLTVALWNVETLDWRDRDAQIIYDRIMSSAADNKVIILHDIHPASVDAAVRAIPELVAAGYQLVTISELRSLRP